MLSGRELNAEIAERYSRWLAAQRYSRITLRMYARTVSKFCSFLDSTPVTNCTPFEIQEYLVKVSKTQPAESSLHAELHALRIFYDFLAMGNLVIWAPPRMVKLRPKPRRVPIVLTEKQVSRLMGATRNVHERALLEVFYGTGCRTGEIRSMKVQDVDFTAKRIRVRGKTGTRFVHFLDETGNALRKYIKRRETGYLFIEAIRTQRLRPRRTSGGAWRCRWKRYDSQGNGFKIADEYIGTAAQLSYRHAVAHFSKIATLSELIRPLGLWPLCREAITRTVRKIGLRVGIRVTPYILRHSFATHLLDHGADISVIKELMGHRCLETTNVYAHVSKPHLRRTFERCHPRKNLYWS
jgi:integrase/recombinase XerC